MGSEWYDNLKKGLEGIGLLYRKEEEAYYYAALDDYAELVRKNNWYFKLPSDIRNRYDLCLSFNYMKFSFAAESFGKPLNYEAATAGTAFILAGCVIDSLLDEGNPEHRELALRKLDWPYCERYFVWFGSRREAHTIDYLYETIGHFLEKGKQSKPQYYDDILSQIRRAAQAESLTGTQGQRTETTVIEKSVLFTAIGFQLAFFGEYTAQEKDIFFQIGDIFRLIDDLCDLEEDEYSGQANSLLLKMSIGSHKAFCEAAISELNKKLMRLQGFINQDFYRFLRYEVCAWTLGCPEIYGDGQGLSDSRT